MTFEDEKKNGIRILSTNRLNQDIIENVFSIFRQKGGYNKNLTARIIRTSFYSTSIYSLIYTSKGTNCEQSEEQYQENLEIVDNLKNKIINEDETDTESSTSSTSSSLSPATKNIKKNEVTIQDCSVTYFSGYQVHTCLQTFNCKNCKIDLIMNTCSRNKNYSNV